MMEQLEKLKSELRSGLLNYMRLKGIKLSSSHNFHCPNRNAHKHGDKVASASYWKSGMEYRWQCHACGEGSDIFAMAHVVDNLPIRGSAFVTKTIPTLCKELGIAFNESIFDERFRKRLSVVKINEAVVDFITRETPKLEEFLKQRELSIDDARTYLIGHTKYENLYSYLRTKYSEEQIASAKLGHGPHDVRSTGAIQLFSEDRLLFVVCDSGGSPIGFAGRDMYHEEKKADPKVEDLSPKYINTPTTEAYKKSTAMFLLDRALKHTKETGELYVFEGYTDAVTAHKHGLGNSAALGGVAFSKDHLDTLTSSGIGKIILCLDSDPTGQEKMINIVEKVFKSNHSLNLDLVIIPEGKDDPDSMIRKEGVEAFKSLKRMSLVEYVIYTTFVSKKSLSEDIDKRINTFMHWLANYTRQPMLRRRAVNILAETVERPAPELWEQFEYIKTIEDNDIASKIDVVWGDMTSQGRRLNLNDKILLLEKTQNKLFRYTRHSITGSDRDYEQELEEIKKSVLSASFQTLKTGNPRLDKYVHIPKGAAFIGLAGYPNHGKSALCRTLAMDVLANNPDVVVLYFTLDDPKSATIPAFIARMMDLEINNVKYPLSVTIPEIRDSTIEKVKVGFDNMRRMAAGDLQWKNRVYGQLLMKDQSEIVSVVDLKRMVEIVASDRKNDGKKIVLFVDSLHTFMDVGSYGGDIRATMMDTAQQLKRICTQYEIPIFSVLEMNKSERIGKKKPTLNSISETIRIEYLLDLGVIIWNDLKAKGQKMSKLSWKHPKTGEIYPYLDIDIQKNKLGYFEGSIFMKFTPPKNSLVELTIQEQKDLLTKDEG